MIGEFSVIKGGLESLPSGFEIESFLRYNFLTWQTQEKKIITRQPEWLTHYYQDNDRLVIRLYYKDEEGEIIQSDHLLFMPDSYNLIYTVNVSFPYIAGQYPDINILFYDVFIVNDDDVRVSYIQRYLPIPEGDNDEIYVFENTLGGIDTLLCTGKREILTSSSTDIITIGETERELEVDNNLKYRQYTGFIETKNQVFFLIDFFLSKKRYHFSDFTFRVILIPEQEQSWKKDNPSGFFFEYKYEKKTGYNFVNRMDSLPDVKEYFDPASLFFLERRLADYPQANIDGEWLIPVQSPYGSDWFKLSLKALLQLAAVDPTKEITLETNEIGYTVGLEKMNQNGSLALSVKLEESTNKTLDEGHLPIKVNQYGEMFTVIPWKIV
jgi:hypothetical protein